MIKKLVVISSILVIATLALAATYEERYEKQKAIVDAQLQRQHELQVEQVKAEVLGRLALLESTKVNVSASASNRTEVRQETRIHES